MFLTIGFHFGRPYAASDLLSLVAAIRPFLATERLKMEVLLLKPEEVTFAKIANGSVRESDVHRFEWKQSELESHSADVFPLRIFASFREPACEIQVVSWVGKDSHFTSELWIELGEMPPTAPLSSLVAGTIGEKAFLDILGSVQCLWAMPGVQEYTPSLMEVISGFESLPADCAYYGPQTVQALGVRLLKDGLEDCPRVHHLRSGGIFFCWSWDGSMAAKSPGFQRFTKTIGRVAPGALSSLQP